VNNLNLLRAFYRSDGLNLAGKTISRAAVRAVILDGDQILLVYSPVNHDYKFPGGGVEEDENHVEALSREIREECGLILEKVQGEFGLVVEYSKPREEGFDVFKHLSHYYLCSVQSRFMGQKLDRYEWELGFRPKWVPLLDALERNRSVLKGHFGEPPRWTRRDTYVLRKLVETHLTDGVRER